MTELQASTNSQSPLYISAKKQDKVVPVQYALKRKPPPNMAKVYLNQLWRHVKDEYWAYIALGGLTLLYTGVMLAVFGFTDIVSEGTIEWIGVVLIMGGVALILTSGILYHRKNRRLRPCICCGIDMDDEPDMTAKKTTRLRFAPNLISPYYDMVKEQQTQQQRHHQYLHGPDPTFITTPIEELADDPIEAAARPQDPIDDPIDPRGTPTPLTTPVQDFSVEEEQKAYNSEGSSAALITRDKDGIKVTPC